MGSQGTKNADETLNIRTSTMIVGIWSTGGLIKVMDRWATETCILEDTVQCSATDPVTGQVKTETLHAGDKAIATASTGQGKGQLRHHPGALAARQLRAYPQISDEPGSACARQ